MKQCTARQLATVYAGCFLGAGYVSGQELWQFFGVFGMDGVRGLLLSGVLQGLLCLVFVSLSRRRETLGVETLGVEEAVVRWERRGWRTAVGTVQLILPVGTAVVMSAGVGALTDQQLGGGGRAASALFVLAVGLTAMRGTEGLFRVFTRVVPLLTAAAMAIALWTAVRCGDTLSSLPPATGRGSPILPHWTLSAASFVACNLFGSLAVLLPLSPLIPDLRTARRGAVAGAALVMLVACAILFCLLAVPESVTCELPMLYLAGVLHPAAGRAFALLLLVAMFGAGLTGTVAAEAYLSGKYAFCARHRAAVIAACSALSFGGGLFGFGDLIGWIYPIFGYVGIASLMLTVAHERHLRCREKRRRRQVRGGENGT